MCCFIGDGAKIKLAESKFLFTYENLDKPKNNFYFLFFA